MLEKKETLFEWGEFRAHSGLTLPFKIECDALNEFDIACIAGFIASKTSFGSVEAVPRGGLRLAAALEQYAEWKPPLNVLIVDDVLTTGRSMEEKKAIQFQSNVIGWVIFARIELPDWINAVFTMTTHDSNNNLGEEQ